MHCSHPLPDCHRPRTETPVIFLAASLMGANGRTPSTVGRGSISVVTLLLALPKLLLLPSLTGAFFAPIGVVSSSARSSSSAASSPGGISKAQTPSLGRHPDQRKGLFAGANSSPEDNSGAMPPQNAGSSDGLGDDAAAQLLSAASSVTGEGGVGLGDGDGVGDERELVGAAGAGVVAEPEPALINVAKGKQGAAAATSLWNVPNMLTMARVVAIPIFVALFYAPLPRRNVWCSAIFAGAAFTDWLDGYIARRQGIVTPFGSFLDPVADKLLVSTALIVLSERLGPWMTICSVIILCRELGISALREWMAQLGLRETVKVGNAGKWKTATQMIALSMLLLLEPGAMVTLINPVTFMPIAKGLLYVSTILTVTSGSGYLKAAWPTLMGRDSE